MNDKTKTLIVAVFAIITVSLIVDSKDSIQQTLSLIAFIMIFHFYLQRHMTDIYDISQDFSKQFKDMFGIGQKSKKISTYKDVQIVNPQTLISPNLPRQQDIVDINEIKEIQLVICKHFYTKIKEFYNKNRDSFQIKVLDLKTNSQPIKLFGEMSGKTSCHERKAVVGMRIQILIVIDVVLQKHSKMDIFQIQENSIQEETKEQKTPLKIDKQLVQSRLQNKLNKQITQLVSLKNKIDNKYTVLHQQLQEARSQLLIVNSQSKDFKKINNKCDKILAKIYLLDANEKIIQKKALYEEKMVSLKQTIQIVFCNWFVNVIKQQRKVKKSQKKLVNSHQLQQNEMIQKQLITENTIPFINNTVQSSVDQTRQISVLKKTSQMQQQKVIKKKPFWGVHRFLQVYQLIRQIIFLVNDSLIIWCIPQQNIWEYEYIQVQVSEILIFVFNLAYYRFKFVEFQKQQLIKKSAISGLNICLGIWKFVNTVFLIMQLSLLISQKTITDSDHPDLFSFFGIVANIILVSSLWFQGSQVFEGFEQCFSCIKAEQIRKQNKNKKYQPREAEQTKQISDMLQKLKQKNSETKLKDVEINTTNQVNQLNYLQSSPKIKLSKNISVNLEDLENQQQQ